MRKHLKYLRKEKGMTLVELLAVLVILGIVAAIAVPMIGNIMSESKQKAELNDALNIIAAAKLAQANGDLKGDDGTLTAEKLVEKGYLNETKKGTYTVKFSNKQWIISGYDFKESELGNGEVSEKDILDKLAEIEGTTTPAANQ